MESNKVILTEIPDEYTYERINSGACGVCYLTKDGKVFKEFFAEIDNLSLLEYIANKYRCNHLLLPEQFVFLQTANSLEFIGYIRKYVEGQALSSLDDKVECSKLIKALCELEKEIIMNIKNGLEYHDTHGENVFYTPDDEIKIIDPDLFEISYEENFREKVNGTLMDMNYSLNSGVFEIANLKNSPLASLVQRSHKYYERGFLKPSDYVSELVSTLESTSESPILTIGDVKKELKLIKGA